MPKKFYFSNNPDFFKISKQRWISGILVGLLYTFSFYSLLYLTREVFRVLSVNDIYDFWVLTDEEVGFYNLIFAFLSVILGQSVCFIFWLDRPKRFFGKNNYRRSVIINDQRVLNWSFLSWFSRLAVLFGAFLGLGYHYYAFSLYPGYNYMFVLIVVVLFLQSWSTLRITYLRKSFKWMMISAVVVAAFSFGLSKVNLIDYEAVNNVLYAKSLRNNYNLDLPESNVYELLYNLSYVENLYIVERKGHDADSLPVILYDNREIPFDALQQTITHWRTTKSEREIALMTVHLHIHNTVKMKFVNMIKSELVKAGIYNVAYAVVPVNPEFDRRHYRGLAFRMKLPIKDIAYRYREELIEALDKSTNLIDIKNLRTGDYAINGFVVSPLYIKDALKQLIKRDLNYLVVYHADDNISFIDNLNVFLHTMDIIRELRNIYAVNIYSKEYYWLDHHEQYEIRLLFPYNVLEMNDDMRILLEYE